jgi:hypothetical protein
MILFKVLTKIVKDGSSQFQNFRVIYRKFHEIITVRLGYHKCCARWVPKMLTGEHKMQRIVSVLVEFTLLTALISLRATDYHLFTYLKNWLGSQRFSNNEAMVGVET